MTFHIWGSGISALVVWPLSPQVFPCVRHAWWYFSAMYGLCIFLCLWISLWCSGISRTASDVFFSSRTYSSDSHWLLLVLKVKHGTDVGTERRRRESKGFVCAQALTQNSQYQINTASFFFTAVAADGHYTVLCDPHLLSCNLNNEKHDVTNTPSISMSLFRSPGCWFSDLWVTPICQPGPAPCPHPITSAVWSHPRWHTDQKHLFL